MQCVEILYYHDTFNVQGRLEAFKSKALHGQHRTVEVISIVQTCKQATVSALHFLPALQCKIQVCYLTASKTCNSFIHVMPEQLQGTVAEVCFVCEDSDAYTCFTASDPIWTMCTQLQAAGYLEHLVTRTRLT